MPPSIGRVIQDAMSTPDPTKAFMLATIWSNAAADRYGTYSPAFNAWRALANRCVGAREAIRYAERNSP